MILFPFDSSWKEEDRFRIEGHNPSGARPPDNLLGALCVSETASRTGVEELDEDEDGLEGADDGDVGAEILDGVLGREPREDGLDGVAGRRSADGDLFACDPAGVGDGARPAFGDGCLLGVPGAAAGIAATLRFTAASLWPLAQFFSGGSSDFRSSTAPGARISQASIHAPTELAQIHPH